MMKQFTKQIEIDQNVMGIKDITQQINQFVESTSIKKGILNLSILHTTASLIIQENMDPNVLSDLEDFFLKLAPMDKKYLHSSEGPDDMPAHIKTSLTNSNLTLSIINSKILLGTWQGIYLFEHRKNRDKRNVFAHILGE